MERGLHADKHKAEKQKFMVGFLNGERSLVETCMKSVLCSMFKSESGKVSEGQSAEDSELFKVFKTEAAFEGVHVNHTILKGLAVTD